MLVCVVQLVMARPGTPPDLVKCWKKQQSAGRPLSPLPNGQLRTWRGSPEGRDWERLEAFLIRDGWRLISNERSFVDDGEVKEHVSLGQSMPQIQGV